MVSNGKSSPYRGVTLFRPTNKWRAQISANGKTTSLGDHDTEEQAATAFDRAAINKAGRDAKTNFPIERYTYEIEELQAMDLVTLVAMLRTKARKSVTQTSHFRGVSLLKQTRRWHAQINIGGKQVHLGFFPTEEYAARSYDRAAINKGANEPCGKIVTNFDINDYDEEFDVLRRVSQDDLVFAFSTERKRRTNTSSDPQHPPRPVVLPLRPIVFVGNSTMPHIVTEKDKAAVKDLLRKAERAQPKSTVRKPLYQDFGLRNRPGFTSKSEAESEPVLEDAPPGHSSTSWQGARDTNGFERLLAGVRLASLEDGPQIELPLIHPLTGAPAKVAGPYRGETVEEISAPDMDGAQEKALPLPQARGTAVDTRKEKSRPPTEGRKRVERPKPIRGLKRGGGAVNLVIAPSKYGGEAAIPLSSSEAPGKQMGMEAERAAGRPMLNSKQDTTKARQGISFSPGFTSRPAEPRTPPVSPTKPPLNAITQGKDPLTTRPPKRPRTQLQEGAIRPEPRVAWEGWHQEHLLSPPRLPMVAKEMHTPMGHLIPRTPNLGIPGRAGWEGLSPQPAPRLSLQERFSQLQESPVQPSEAPPQPAALPGTPARPLTKRQEALAIRRTEEAAATLAAKLAPDATARRLSPLPEEVGEALMDFAEAAEIAELEDRQLDEQTQQDEPYPVPLAVEQTIEQQPQAAKYRQNERDLTCKRQEESEFQGSSQDKDDSPGDTSGAPDMTGPEAGWRGSIGLNAIRPISRRGGFMFSSWMRSLGQ